jgi:uncharacterized protein (TIGR02186 family)
MLRIVFSLLFLLTSLAGVRAADEKAATEQQHVETIDIGVSTDEIAITSDFTGADLTIFGALGNTDSYLQAIGQYDIVVTLEGPRTDATLRKKSNFFGIWINRKSMTFSDVPQSYSLASTRVVDMITSPLALANISIGISDIRLSPLRSYGDISDLKDFRDAFRRLKISEGLFETNEAGVRFISPTLFKAALRLPANVPNGVHTVHAYLFKSGVFVMEKKLPLRVVKTGFEQAITDAAHNNPLPYGVFAVLLAVITGWSASLIFRRD